MSGKASKTGLFDESVLLDSRWLGAVVPTQLASLARSRSAGARLWSWRHSEFLDEWRASVRALRFAEQQLTTCLYGLRHGGASHDTLNRLRTAQQVKERGRWVTDASVHRYRKASLAQSELSKLSTGQQMAARALSLDIDRMFQDRQFLIRTMALAA